jgi:hypothetical protein
MERSQPITIANEIMNASTRSFALVSAVGDDSTHLSWLGDSRIFDVILIYFGDDNEIARVYAEKADLFIRAKGQKLHMVHRLVKENKLHLEDYEYVWFPDSDLLIAPEDINSLFRSSERYGALISQPACIGFTSHGVTRPSSRWLSLVRATTFVEVMAPCFQREALSICLESFGEEESSWGVDDIWFTILEKPQQGLLIFDQIIMEHTKPVNSLERFPNARVNAERLRKKYGVVSNRITLGHFVRPGIWTPNFLVRVYQKLNQFFSR